MQTAKRKPERGGTVITLAAPQVPRFDEAKFDIAASLIWPGWQVAPSSNHKKMH